MAIIHTCQAGHIPQFVDDLRCGILPRRNLGICREVLWVLMFVSLSIVSDPLVALAHPTSMSAQPPNTSIEALGSFVFELTTTM